MLFRTKRILSYCTVASYIFLSGTENAIILPTAWQYLQYIGANQPSILGATLAGYSTCAAVAGIVGGRLGDAYPRKTKFIVALSVLCMIMGNIQYLLGGSLLNIIMGRVVCGFGSGAGAALLAEICRTTSVKERTAVLSFCNGLRQIGLLASPGFQIVLEHFDFSLFGGAIIIRPFNASGLFMAGLWAVFLLFALIFYNNIDVEYGYELLRQAHEGEDFSG
jgi:ceroid-lipofuscinosis MFS transporter 7